MVYFLHKFVHIITQVYGTVVANLVIGLVRFIFTILLNMTRCCPVILHVLRGICSCVVWMFHGLLCNFCKCGRFLAIVWTHTHIHVSIWNNGSVFGNELWFIRFFIVTSENVVVISPKLGHILITIWNNGSEFGYDMIVHSPSPSLVDVHVPSIWNKPPTS